MGACEACGAELPGGLDYSCTYCELEFCPRHRLPETHDCIFQDFIDRPWKNRLDERSKYETTTTRKPRATDQGTASQRNQEGRTAAGNVLTDIDHEVGEERERWKKKHQRDDSSEENPERAKESGRDWEPDSKSPDVLPDGSIAGETTGPISGNADSAWGWRNWIALQFKTPVRTAIRAVLYCCVLLALYLVAVQLL